MEGGATFQHSACCSPHRAAAVRPSRDGETRVLFTRFRQTLHRPSRFLQAQHVSLAPHRRSRMANRNQEVSTSHPSGCISTRDRDRKSTRLNSSHVAISYAVFCLKKK